MAKTIVTHSQEYWPSIARLAGGNPYEIVWDETKNELEVSDVDQENLDIVMANFDPATPIPESWPQNPDLSALSSVSTLYWKNDNGRIIEMDQAEKDTSDFDVMYAEKERLILAVDAKISERIHSGAGFEWPPSSGQFFSLSTNAQIKWVGLMVAKDFITYPLTVPTKDDNIFYTIQDATEAQNMYLTATNTVKTYIADGTSVKRIVREAATISEAQAAADTYLNS